MSNSQFQQVSYGLTQPLINQNPINIISHRNPTTVDKAQLGTLWINESNNTFYTLTSIVNNSANWESSGIGNGTNGQVLIGGGTAPVWNNITAGSGVTITNGVNSITIAASGSLATTLNADTGSATFASGAATIAGGSNISTSATSHTLTVSLVASPSVSGSLTAATGLVALAGGVVTTGTNQFKSLGAGVMQTSGNGTISSTSGTNGQILIGSSPGVPSWSTITAGANVTITNGANSITIAAAGGSGGTVSQLAGNTGVAGPDGGGNVNVVGSGNITVTGDNSHTLTATLTGTTNHAVQVGTSGGALSSLSVGTDGQVLLGASGGNPSFVTPTAGSGLVVTANSTTLSYALSAPVSIANGGTDATSFAHTDGAVYFDGTRLVAASAGTNGQVFLGATGAAPAFATLTSSGGTLTYTTGANSLNIDGTAASTSQAGVVALATNAQAIAGVSSTTATPPSALTAKLGAQTSNGVAYGAGTSSALGWTGAGSNGQVLIGATSGAPAFSSITSTGGTIIITPGANSLNLDVMAGSANKLDADSGFATFTGGVITISGGSTGLTTTASAATMNLTGTLAVGSGGTGANTLTGLLTGNGSSAVTASAITQHDVLVGGASNAVNSVSPSTSGSVLTSNGTGSNPSFQQIGSSGVSFSAYKSSSSTNQTGGGATVLVVFDSAFYNTGSAYNTSTGQFTAPSAGVYTFSTSVTVTSFTSLMTNGSGNIQIKGSGPSVGTYDLISTNPFAVMNANSGNWRWNGSTSVSMSAGDTAQVNVNVTGGSGNTAGIKGVDVAGIYQSWFSGYKCV